ncbi:MAG: alpha/beta hydrolase [Deltaproteobacteria bacterium]|nr:alpha/beta hydrolase [Deltaproteobacteria bacterium]
MSLICFILIIIFLVLVHNYLVQRYFEIKWLPDEIHYIQSDDGFSLAVSRRIPKNRRFKEPIILCHGLGANRYNLDFNPEYSLARRFVQMGYDTYIAEMRTVGLSSKPHLFSEARWNIYFDDIVKYDVPAIIHNARIKSGADKVFWIGHSLGGMIMYAALQNKEVENLVRALVAISSPPVFTCQPELKRFIPILKASRVFSHIKQEFWGKLLSLYLIRAIPYSEVAANIDNIDTPILRRIFVNLASDISSTLVCQIGRWLEEGYIRDKKGETNFSEGISSINIPIFAITGSVDLICPPDAVFYLKSRLRDDQLKVVIAGISTGFSVDYGHGDIIFGRKAPEEIFPLITSYVESRSTRII